MTANAARKLSIVSCLLLCTVLLTCVWSTPPLTWVHAQAKADSPTQSIADTWQGTLHAGQDLRIVVKITKENDGGYKARLL